MSPIKPENIDRYPKNWKGIRDGILDRAKNKCEECGAENHAYGYRDKLGNFHKYEMLEAARLSNAGWKIIKIVLTIAHLDHTPENCEPENLKALCQRCHLRYDAKHHAKNARLTRDAKKGQESFGF